MFITSSDSAKLAEPTMTVPPPPPADEDPEAAAEELVLDELLEVDEPLELEDEPQAVSTRAATRVPDKPTAIRVAFMN